MLTILKNISTGYDNQTYEITRVLTVITYFVFVGMSIYQMIHKGEFDPWTWSASAMTIIASAAGAVRIKDGMKPPRPPKEVAEKCREDEVQ
jgi:hypothetical protein